MKLTTNFAPPDISRYMAQVSRDAFILEAQLVTESNRNGWTAPTLDEPAAPRPVRTSAPVAPVPARGALVPVAFAPVAAAALRRDLDPCAMHEAAHAVCARGQGLPLASVQLTPTGGVTDLAPLALQYPARCAVAAAAGPVLDALLGIDPAVNAHDFARVHLFQHDFLRATGRAMADDPFARAREWLALPAAVAAVNRVAAALAPRGPLTGAQLDALLSTADVRTSAPHQYTGPALPGWRS